MKQIPVSLEYSNVPQLWIEAHIISSGYLCSMLTKVLS
jgi:hypothetical protein